MRSRYNLLEIGMFGIHMASHIRKCAVALRTDAIGDTLLSFCLSLNIFSFYCLTDS